MRGKWVSVRSEMVLVVGLAIVRYIFGGTGCKLPRELRWFKERNGPLIRVIMLVEL